MERMVTVVVTFLIVVVISNGDEGSDGVADNPTTDGEKESGVWCILQRR